jgi:serine/threonine-protein kinase
LLGKYRVDRVIGEGGMGVVLQAHHIDLEEAVAIKVLLPEMLGRDDIVQRFLREAKAAVKLKGEHIARVLDVGRLDPDVDGNFGGVPYIVMEYLEGSDLRAIIKAHGPQEPAIAVDLMMQACEAIAEAHAQGIVHRDIKSANFLITPGYPPQLKVLDFGTATAPVGTSMLTDDGEMIGTPEYMAPEQMRSSRLADTRSDIWSLGVVLYEMLEARLPFAASGPEQLALRIEMDPPDPMAQPAVTYALREVTLKCLEKSLERRYQSVAELSFDLMQFASDDVVARASVERCARLLGRHSMPIPQRVTPPSQPMQRVEPEPSRAPTSVSQSSGEVAGTQRAPHQSLAIISSFFFAIALAGGGVLFYLRATADDYEEPAAQPAAVVDAGVDAAALDDAAIRNATDAGHD